jgi:hypothetical protein
MEVEEDDEFAASDRRRRELAMTYSMFLMFGVLAYQEYRMNNGRGGKRKEVVEHRHNKRSRRRIFGPRRVFDYIQRAHLGPSRKDVERCFGVLQGRWKVLATPLHMMNLKSIASLVACCIVLHNMGVSDRVMGDCNERYVPHSVEKEEEEEAVEAVVEQQDGEDIVVDQRFENDPVAIGRSNRVGRQGANAAVNGLNAFNTELAQTVANRREWMGLKDDLEWNRLQQALIRFKGNSSKTDWAGNTVE